MKTFLTKTSFEINEAQLKKFFFLSDEKFDGR